MQKKLIALAIAGLSSAAFAQSNVTVYGVVNNAFENVKASGATGGVNYTSRNRLSANSSYIGFKGSESLGNGMTAVFQIEQGVNTDTPAANSLTSGTLATRDTFVGIAGGFGTIAAGNLTGPYRAIGAKTDFNPAGSSIGFQGLIGNVGALKTTTDDRTGNTVAYISPKFGGVTAVVAYSANEAKTIASNAANGLNDPLWTVGLTYDNGPIYVAYAHVNAKDKIAGGVVTATGNQGTALLAAAAPGLLGDELKANRLAGMYNFGQGTTVALLWDSQKAELNYAATNTELKRTVWALNAKHEFGANTVFAQYSKAKKLKGSAVDGTGLDTDSGAKQITVGYTYAFSKRTLAQFYYTKVSNEANASYNFYNNGLTAGSLNVGADPVGYGFGLRHTF